METVALTREIDFDLLVKPAADDVGSLRGCDVYRVASYAEDEGALDAFAAWLLKARPDLKGQIDAAVADIVSER